MKKGHISISILTEKFSLKNQAILSAISYLVILITLTLMTQQTFIYAGRSIKNVTGELGIPIYIFIFLGGIGIIIFALSILLDFLKSIQEVVSFRNES